MSVKLDPSQNLLGKQGYVGASYISDLAMLASCDAQRLQSRPGNPIMMCLRRQRGLDGGGHLLANGHR